MSATNGRPRVVAIGGGHGLSRTLLALRGLGLAPTAVVTVADDGGSSGRLRREHGVVALGDMRMALTSLATQDGLSSLFGHRFTGGTLGGHALGNLALLALVEQADGDVVAGVARAAELLGCHGRVLPCTTAAVTLVAALDDAQVAGQVAVMTADGPLRSVWVEPVDPPACPEAVEAIMAADAVVLGPGSLFTSIVPNLLVPGIAEAVASTPARLIHVANLNVQGGETSGMDAQAHLDVLLAHLGRQGLDVVVHDGPPPIGSGPALVPDLSGPQIRAVHRADLAERSGDDRLAAHEPARLAEVLQPLLARP